MENKNIKSLLNKNYIDDSEYEFNEVTGIKRKKFNVLNKRHLKPEEMDSVLNSIYDDVIYPDL